MESFKTIAVFNYQHETIVLKHLLEQEQIPYYFENEITLSVVPMYTTALGGIKLKVHPNDFEEVQQILDNLNNPLKIV
jgi:flagellar biosynthesis/type III secretory pathway protein FliH